MSVALGKTYAEKDSPLEYKEAVTRVWGRLPSTENAAHWLLRFSFADTVNLSVKRWHHLLWESFAFAHPSGFRVPTSADRQPIRVIPSRSEVISIQKWVREVWEKLGKGEVVYVRPSAWVAELQVENNRIVGSARTRMSSCLESFQFETFQVLTSPALIGRFRFCKRDKCRRPLLAAKRQAFCSTSCSQHHRTSVYRTKNREQFREKRREYYARKQRELSGMRNLRIQTRKGKHL